jgi:hypothetical protein
VVAVAVVAVAAEEEKAAALLASFWVVFKMLWTQPLKQ